MIRAACRVRIREYMIVLAHAVHWLEAALLAVPAAVVVTSIVRSLRMRRGPVSRTREEVIR